jgi:hypothetical protein
VGIGIFLAALSVFLFGPERDTPVVTIAGFVLQTQTITALGIIFMIFGAITALKSFAEWKFQ